MKKILLGLLLTGCSQETKITKLDIINSKIEVCTDLINIFFSPYLEKECKHDPLSDKILINIKNPYTGYIHVYDIKTGEELK